MCEESVVIPVLHDLVIVHTFQSTNVMQEKENRQKAFCTHFVCPELELKTCENHRSRASSSCASC